MRIHFSFDFSGQELDAEASYTPGRNGTAWEPPDPEDLEILTLRCEGVDVSFLLHTRLEEDLYTAAYEALTLQAASARADMMDYRREERMCHFC